MDFLYNFLQTIPKFPSWVVFLKFSHIADPPDVVADPRRLLVAPRQFAAADFFAQIDCLEHRTVTMTAAANIINFSNLRRPNDHEYPWMIALSEFSNSRLRLARPFRWLQQGLLIVTR
jgi:hypothetical protein